MFRITSRLFLFYVLTASCILVLSCKSDSSKKEYVNIKGETMGTTYSITIDQQIPNIKYKVDSILLGFNAVFSTYDSLSLISQFNQTLEEEFCFKDVGESFFSVLETSKEIYSITDGYFDPTVMPLVSYWGFGPQKHQNNFKEDSVKIDSLKNFVGLDKLTWKVSESELCISKSIPYMSLDLSAIAKGYGVDKVANFLTSKGIENFMVEIGGEVMARGHNSQNVTWSIGIDKPISSLDLKQRELQALVHLENKALASSGNYRNFYELNGKMIGHTINPKSGFPETNNLLGVSVIAINCKIADGYATAFMAQGMENAKKTLKKIENVDAYFVYVDSNNVIQSEYTEGFKEVIKIMN